MGKRIESNYPCHSCNSSDAVSLYLQDDGRIDSTCFSCRHYEPRLYKDSNGIYRPDRKSSLVSSESQVSEQKRPRTTSLAQEKQVIMSHNPHSKEQILADFKSFPIRSIPDRLLTEETTKHFGIRVALSEQDGRTITHHKYPVTKKDKLSGYMERIVSDKSFYHHGDTKNAELFGQSVSSGGKTLYITEGQLDAAALYQTLKSYSSFEWNPSVVSINNGAASAVRELSLNNDFIDQYEKIVLVFDMDDPGQEAVEECCKLLAGKVYIASLSEKDPCDMLLQGKGEELYWACIKKAKKYKPDGIVNGSDTWDRYQHKKEEKCYAYPEDWQDINHKTYGVRLGSVVTITSGSGMGKSQFLRELQDHFFRTTPFNQAHIILEEDVSDSVANLMSIYLNKRITLPDVHVTEEEEREAHDFYFKEGRISFYDHFGGMDDDNLFSKIRYFAATGHRFIFLDHLSIIVSEFAAQGGERERIDTIMTKLAKMCKELQLVIFLVVHLKKAPFGNSFEQGFVPSLDDLRGSGSLKQLSWDVIALSRNQQHPDPFCANTTRVTILKCRFTGRTGESDYLNFNDQSGRMRRVAKPRNYELEDK